MKVSLKIPPVSKSTILFFSFVIFLFSCNNHKNKEQRDDNVVKTDSLTLIPVDTIIIPITNEISYNNLVELVEIGNKRYLGTQVKGKNKYELYDLDSRKYYKTLTFDYHGPNGVGDIRYVKIINWDSIFVIQRLTKNLYLLDSAGTVIKKWTFNNTSNNKFVSGITARYIASPLSFIKNKLYFQKVPAAGIQSNKFWRDTIQLIFDLKSNTLTNEVGFYPDIYKQGVFYGTYNMFPDIIIRNDETIVYSFSLVNNLYIFHPQKPMRTISAPTKYFNDKVSVPAKDMLADRSYAEHYEIQKGSYRFLNYDKYNNYTLRLVVHPINLYDNEGKMHVWEDKPFSIQIFDSEFKLLGEPKFKGETFYFRNIIPIHEGVLIANTNKKNPDLKENRFEFILFKYAKNDEQ